MVRANHSNRIQGQSDRVERVELRCGGNRLLQGFKAAKIRAKAQHAIASALKAAIDTVGDLIKREISHLTAAVEIKIAPIRD